MIKKETVIKLLDDEITKQKELIEHYQYTSGIMFADNASTDELLVLEKIKDMINKLPTINQIKHPTLMINYELIETIKKVLEGLGWVGTIDKSNYPFVIYEKSGNEQQFKLPRSSTLKYAGTYEIINEIIEYLSIELDESYDELVFKLANPKYIWLMG